MIPRLVPEIEGGYPERDGGMEQEKKKKKDWSWSILVVGLYPVKFLNFYANLSSFLAENKFPVDVFRRRQITVFTKNRTLCWEFEQKDHIKFGLDHSSRKQCNI